MKNEMAINMKV